jgi:hypothetical protein
MNWIDLIGADDALVVEECKRRAAEYGPGTVVRGAHMHRIVVVAKLAKLIEEKDEEIGRFHAYLR